MLLFVRASGFYMNTKISIDELKLDNIITNDVYTEDFKLIIKKGTLMTQKILDRLRLFNVESVYIEGDEAKKSPVHFTSTQEFIEFKKNYLSATDSLQNSLNAIVERSLSQKELNKTIDDCISLYSSSVSSYSVLDMLNHMRDFSDATFVHSINVGMISAIIGKWSGKSPEDERILVSCGLFHDIGKLLIPKEILNKPGKLTDEEFEIIKEHPKNGYGLLKNLPLDERIKYSALMHHEKIDGSGYPFKLKGSHIDDFAKIVTIADIYDALTANRVYRGPICPFDALEIFEDGGYNLYDTNYLLTFLHNIINSYLHSHVMLSDGNTGEIIMVNQRNPSKPVVQTNGDFVDLSKDKSIKIEKVLQD